MAKKEKKLSRIIIHLHHPEDEDHEGFHIEHEYTEGASGSYAMPERQGVFKHHGEVMQHVHEHIKDHGPNVQEELVDQHSYEQGEHDAVEAKEHEHACALCDDTGGKEARKEEAHPNIVKHGFEKGTSNAFGKGEKKSSGGHSKEHPGFKAVANKISGKEHLGAKAASAILAARTRGASGAAHKANPRLNRVKG